MSTRVTLVVSRSLVGVVAAAIACSLGGAGAVGMATAAALPAASMLALPGNAESPPNPALTTATATLVVPGAVLGGVSCWSPGSCSAVGEYVDSSDASQAMAASASGGVWAQAAEVTPPANAASDPYGALLAVSCPIAANCTAVGGYDDASGFSQAMVATQSGGTWAQETEIAAPANAATDPSASLDGVSCPSPGECTAVGYYVDSSGAHEAMAATESRGTWGQAAEVTAPSLAPVGNPNAYLSAVSCTSAGDCSAVGSYQDRKGRSQAMATADSGGQWRQATALTAPTNSAAQRQDALAGVSCWSPGDCTAAGQYVDSSGTHQLMTATESGGSWAQAAEVGAPANALVDPSAYLSAIACWSAGDCTAAGGYVDTLGNGQALAATESGGTWGQALEVISPLPLSTGANPNAYLAAVSCSGAGGCGAVGQYTDSLGFAQAMVIEPLVLPAPARPQMTTPRLRIASGRIRLLARTFDAPVALSCQSARCTGTIGITDPVAATTPKTKLHTPITSTTAVLLARASYSLNPGTAETIDLAPTARGLALLQEASEQHALHVELNATVNGANAVRQAAVVT